eukprot:1235878-Pyramimonas_sp.AAC.1
MGDSCWPAGQWETLRAFLTISRDSGSYRPWPPPPGSVTIRADVRAVFGYSWTFPDGTGAN